RCPGRHPRDREWLEPPLRALAAWHRADGRRPRRSGRAHRCRVAGRARGRPRPARAMAGSQARGGAWRAGRGGVGVTDTIAGLAEGYRERLRRELLDRPPGGDLRVAAERVAWELLHGDRVALDQADARRLVAGIVDDTVGLGPLDP